MITFVAFVRAWFEKSFCGSSVFFVFSFFFFFNFFFFSKENLSSDESDEIFENRRERKNFCFFLKFFSLSFSLFCHVFVAV